MPTSAEIVVCREPEHDSRCREKNGIPVRHARLRPYFKKGKKWFHVKGICDECLKYVSASERRDILPIDEAIRKRNMQKRLNNAGSPRIEYFKVRDGTKTNNL